eukprot:10886706-Alexandrium_andersonii.AAC.1
MSRPSSNQRGAPACSRNHAAISASQPSSVGPFWTASRVKPCSHSARGFHSLAAVPVGHPASAATAAFSAA